MARDLQVNGLEYRGSRLLSLQNVSFDASIPSLVGISSTSVFPVRALFTVLSGEDRPAQGEVLIEGFAPQPGSGNIALLQPDLMHTQEPSHFTVSEWLRLKMELAAHGSSTGQWLSADMKEKLGESGIDVDELVQYPPEELSFYERRMLLLAAYSSISLKVLLISRFLSALPRNERNLVFALIKKIAQDRLVLIHDADLSLLMECEKVLVFHKNTLLANDAPHMIGANPAVRQAFTGLDDLQI